MSGNYSTAVNTAREYYNSEDADSFYSLIWGGEDIHIGCYANDAEPIETASRRTVSKMADRLRDTLSPNSRVLDLGAGYGGAARYLAERFGCQVVALNLSETENSRCRKLNAEQSLDHLVEVVDGSFEAIPSDDHRFDVVWSQDAILHSGNRTQVISEVSRVLKPGGDFVFTDPMQADDCPVGVLQPILNRIHLNTLASPKFYIDQCDAVGMRLIDFECLTPQLVRHYARVLEETTAREMEINELISPDYLQRMKAGLGHWIDGGHHGYLAWGIFHFTKSELS
ncbi:Sarcosine/dimethylglycine N-methyltransferase [Novipirellula galeiformis]|uniref:Sarcosine/dimethylglycine N-methyltransferase n=1 Tax=Novipirellula galeiformis TaxID=2528004 RepID=A0A5C6CLG4_9BACT|nr:class I SAM-dependent methyltransferase [Novipirellula galeiformis]TWU25460.1 Sarcosine/dimethylglycine N-methyltransferase [Novipirellula galeiformis]